MSNRGVRAKAGRASRDSHFVEYRALDDDLDRAEIVDRGVDRFGRYFRISSEITPRFTVDPRMAVKCAKTEELSSTGDAIGQPEVSAAKMEALRDGGHVLPSLTPPRQRHRFSNENLFAHGLSNETKRLLMEVKKVRKVYKNRTVSEQLIEIGKRPKIGLEPDDGDLSESMEEAVKKFQNELLTVSKSSVPKTGPSLPDDGLTASEDQENDPSHWNQLFISQSSELKRRCPEEGSYSNETKLARVEKSLGPGRAEIKSRPRSRIVEEGSVALGSVHFGLRKPCEASKPLVSAFSSAEAESERPSSPKPDAVAKDISTINVPVNEGQLNDRGLERPTQKPRSPQKPSLRPKSAAEKQEKASKAFEKYLFERKQQSREGRLGSEKPWHKNMKRTVEESPESKEGPAFAADVKESEKPWRSNMKSISTDLQTGKIDNVKSGLQGGQNGEATSLPVSKKTAKSPSEKAKVRQYMKAKRHQIMEQKKKEQEEKVQVASELKKRLLTLEVYRMEAAAAAATTVKANDTAISPGTEKLPFDRKQRNQRLPLTRNQLDSNTIAEVDKAEVEGHHKAVIMAPAQKIGGKSESTAGRKNRQEEKLKQLLTELTAEMRNKYLHSSKGDAALAIVDENDVASGRDPNICGDSTFIKAPSAEEARKADSPSSSQDRNGPQGEKGQNFVTEEQNIVVFSKVDCEGLQEDLSAEISDRGKVVEPVGQERVSQVVQGRGCHSDEDHSAGDKVYDSQDRAKTLSCLKGSDEPDAERLTERLMQNEVLLNIEKDKGVSFLRNDSNFNDVPVRDPGPSSTPSLPGGLERGMENTADGYMKVQDPCTPMSFQNQCRSLHLRAQVQQLHDRHQQDLELILGSRVQVDLPNRQSVISPLSHLSKGSTEQTSGNSSRCEIVGSISKKYEEDRESNSPQTVSSFGRCNDQASLPDSTPVPPVEVLKVFEPPSTFSTNSPPPHISFSAQKNHAPVSASVAEVQPQLASDPFSFIASVQRKFSVHPEPRQTTPPILHASLMALSEGPLSSSSSSSTFGSRLVRQSHVQGGSVHDHDEPVKDACSKLQGEKTSHRKQDQDNLKESRDPGPSRSAHAQFESDLTSMIPTALQLRFRAELDQLESVQEAERQLQGLANLKDVVSSRQNVANFERVSEALSKSKAEKKRSEGRSSIGIGLDHEKPSGSASKGQKESRKMFEERVRRELQELLDSRLRTTTSHTEAAIATANAAKELARLTRKLASSSAVGTGNADVPSSGPSIVDKDGTRVGHDSSENSGVNAAKTTKRHPNTELVEEKRESSKSVQTRSSIKGSEKQADVRLGEKDNDFSWPSSKSKASEIPEELMTLISKAESNIPEIFSLVERVDRSSASIQKTITEVIKELTAGGADGSKSQPESTNITEQVSGELSSYSSKFETVSNESTMDNLDGGVEDEDRGAEMAIQPPESVKVSAGGEANRKPTGPKPHHHHQHSKKGYSHSKLESREDHHQSFSEFTKSLFLMQMEEQGVRARHQYAMIKARERALDDKLEAELAATKGSESDGDSMKKAQERLLKKHRERKAELKHLKFCLKVAERDRQFLMRSSNQAPTESPNNSFSRSSTVNSLNTDTLMSLAHLQASDDNNSGGEAKPEPPDLASHTKDRMRNAGPIPSASYEVNPINSNSQHRRVCGHGIIEGTAKSQPLLAAEGLKKKVEMQSGSKVAALKAPLSPKSSTKVVGPSGLKVRKSTSLSRKRSHAADSDDSMSVSVSDDHSDLEIRISALQEELKNRMLEAARLKRRQSTKDRERLKIQEEALKNQIEAYDNLISTAKADLEAAISSPPQQIPSVQPLILAPARRLLDIEAAATPQAKEDELVSSRRSDINSEDNLTAQNKKPLEQAKEDLARVDQKVLPVGPYKQLPVDLKDSLERSESSLDSSKSISLPEGREDSHATIAKGSVQVLPEEDHIAKKPVAEPDAARSEAKHNLDGSGNRRFDELSESIATEIADTLVQDTYETLSKLTKLQVEELKKSNGFDAGLQLPESTDSILHESNAAIEGSLEPAAECAIASADNQQENYLGESSKDGLVDIPALDDGRDFSDDDCLSIRQESEQLRQQQLLIEQEIQRIQQENVQIESRKIPDKPPPPYTPPSSSSPSSQVLRLKPNQEQNVVPYVPSSNQEITDLAQKAAVAVYRAREEIQMTKGGDLSDFGSVLSKLEMPEDARNNGCYSGDGVAEDSWRIFENLIFDVVKEIAGDMYACQSDVQNPLWLPQKPITRKILALPKTQEDFCDIVQREVGVAFGFQRKAARENLIVRWCPRKKRDRVDQILVRELHVEEAAWTDYANDEAAVKDSISESLFELLLEDTVSNVKHVYAMKTG